MAVFTNSYLVGTLIIGGEPVVIPLLRKYVVEPGWASDPTRRHPGASRSKLQLCRLSGFLARYPSFSWWYLFKKVVISLLRGMNAVAVGLVFAAVAYGIPETRFEWRRQST